MAPDDPTLPAVPHLLGPDAGDLLEVAVEAAGGRVLDHRVVQVLYQPGRSLTVRFSASVSWAGDDPRDETLLAGAGPTGAPEGTLPLQAGDIEVGVWRYPFDPGLPGLATAVHPDRAGAFLEGRLGAEPTLRVRTYRPGRRAVVEVTGDPTAPGTRAGPADAGADGEGHRAFLKVVRPAEVDRLVTVHRRLGAHLRVPAVLGVDREAGVVALAALPGVPLRDAVRDLSARRPDPAEVLVLLDALRAVPLPEVEVRRLPLLPAAQGHLQLLGRVLPAEATRIERLARRLHALAEAEPEVDVLGRRATVHGDFHDAQVMVRGGTVTGLLDLDDAGPGDPLDDLANGIGHLHTLALGAGPARLHIAAWANAVRHEVAGEVDPVALDTRVAAVAVGLATGPFREQAAGWQEQTVERLALAEAWLERAERPTRSTSSTRSRAVVAPAAGEPSGGGPGVRELSATRHRSPMPA
jgi:aminoglycoside phosphotransferase